MDLHGKPRIILTITIAAIIFIAAIFLPKLIFSGLTARLLATQGIELILALAAIMVLGKGRFAEYGFCKPHFEQSPPISPMRWCLIGLGAMALGAMATLAILLSGAAGNPVVKQLTFPQIVLFVWIFSSTIEEIFARGFIQSDLDGVMDAKRQIPFLRVNFPTFVSALFFALMHLSLWLRGADFKTLLITILFAFSVGLLAGHVRARTGSLIPAIGAHMLANIGGVVGGIIYAIVTILGGGKLPIR